MCLQFPFLNGVSKLRLDFVSRQSTMPSFLYIIELTFPSCSLHADNSELGIQLGPELIFPPFVCLVSTAHHKILTLLQLKLTDKEQIYWLFEFVRPE